MVREGDIEDIGMRLKAARVRAGYKTAADAAKALGLPYQTYAGHEAGKSGIRHQSAAKYADKFKVSLEWLLTGRGDLEAETTGPMWTKMSKRERMEDGGSLPVLGVIRAGHWLDVSLFDEGVPETYIPVLPDPRYYGNQYALRVEGTSMNKIFPDGSWVSCVDFASSGLSLQRGMIAHVERRNGQLVEITLKQLQRTVRNLWTLEPMSTDPKWETILFDPDDEKGEVMIRGIATGMYMRI